MTISKTAEEIASDWVDESKVHRLELEILRHMEHHVAKAVAAEREACAKIVEDNQEGFSSGVNGSGFILSPRLHGNETGLSFARAIRARSNQT